MFKNQVSNSEELRVLVTEAKEWSRKWKHNFVGTEHVLVTICSSLHTGVNEILTQCGTGLNEVIQETKKHVETGSAEEATPKLTPRLKTVVSMCTRFQRNTQLDGRVAECLLHAILEEGKGAAAKVLNQLGVSREHISSQLIGKLFKDRKSWIYTQTGVISRIWNEEHAEIQITGVAVPTHPGASLFKVATGTENLYWLVYGELEAVSNGFICGFEMASEHFGNPSADPAKQLHFVQTERHENAFELE